MSASSLTGKSGHALCVVSHTLWVVSRPVRRLPPVRGLSPCPWSPALSVVSRPLRGLSSCAWSPTLCVISHPSQIHTATSSQPWFARLEARSRSSSQYPIGLDPPCGPLLAGPSPRLQHSPSSHHDLSGRAMASSETAPAHALPGASMPPFGCTSSAASISPQDAHVNQRTALEGELPPWTSYLEDLVEDSQRIDPPTADLMRSTATSEVAPCLSSAGLTSTISRQMSFSAAAANSITRAASL